MTTKTKGRNRWHGATQMTANSSNFTTIKSSIKVAIVLLAVWGVIPAGTATWLIQRGGMRDV